ncbi:hypothetical protein ACIA98_23340 [Streptomyces sp. NPDC051366]|uniref:hypothetical protein n=1 Tax=Streptomyces sp. NPDC051366 TaxID=3365652 RepID=UPI00378FE637
MSPDVSFAELNGAYWIDSDSSLHGTEECSQCALLREADATVRPTAGADGPVLQEDPASDTAGCRGIGWVLTTGRPLLLTGAAITVAAALVAVTLG